MLIKSYSGKRLAQTPATEKAKHEFGSSRQYFRMLADTL